ncbi:hypothetical protein NBRC116601_17240 [Cognatishimia sp. WU-CL00825]|uniref:restriction endonuclease subunit S n=1 Tax=Cognatishimia sp. WU-CL00825 TaxID=3127658 RepID=UPI00310C36E6
MTKDTASAHYPTKDLGSLVDFFDNRRKPITASKRESGDIPYYGANGVQGHVKDYLFDEPLILLAEDGGHFDDPARGIAYEITGKSWVNNHAHVLRAKEGVSQRYLLWVLRHYDVTPFISGSTRAKLTKGQAERIPIPVPESLAEQRRIAAILDKSDAIRRKREQALTLADDFLKSVFLEMFGDPHTNSGGWDVGVISDCLTSTVGGWSAKGEARPARSDELGVLKISAVTSGEYIPEENKTVSVVPEGKKLVVPQVGDLLFSRANTRELVAATCIVLDAPQNVFLPDKLWSLEVDPDEATAPYLKFVLTDPGYRYALCLRASGTSGSMLNISKAKLLDHPIPIPPIQKQKDFEKIWWRTQETVKRLKSELEMSNELFGSLSQRAFSGGL